MPYETSTSQAQALLDLALVLNRQTDFDESLRLVAQKTVDILQADSALIMMFNPATQETIKTVIRQGKASKNKKLHTLQTQITGWMLHNQQSFISENIREDDRFERLDMTDVTVHFAMAAVIILGNLTLGSIVIFRSKNTLPFKKSELSAMEYIAAIAAPYLRNTEQLKAYFTPELTENALLKKYAEVGLTGKSKRFIELLHTIEAAARCDVRVVLEGESGTGKELIARAVHRFSGRNGNQFVAVDCGAIPKHLIESELFGFKKGAFTGAVANRKGLIQEADGGTFFIDEVTSLPLEIQAKFMRFLQEGEIRLLGSNVTQKVNVRIISASSQPLHKLVEQGLFREDLYFRLYVYPIHVPPLRERGKDILLLANTFLEKFAHSQGKRLTAFHPDISRFFQSRDWKGNIRELENFVERLVTIVPGETETIFPKHLPSDLRKAFTKTSSADDFYAERTTLAAALGEYEEKFLRQRLVQNGWNQSKTARELRVSEYTLRHKMKKLNIVRPAQHIKKQK